jgi:hypothetical protein
MAAGSIEVAGGNALRGMLGMKGTQSAGACCLAFLIDSAGINRHAHGKTQPAGIIESIFLKAW